MNKLSMLKQLLVVLVLSAIMILCTGSFCGAPYITYSHCGELTVEGTYTLDDLSGSVGVGEPCITISGNDITLIGTLNGGPYNVEGIMITGNRNTY
jgi:hypothetical protein